MTRTVKEAQPPPPVTAAPSDRPRPEREQHAEAPWLALECLDCEEREPAPAGWDASLEVRCTDCGGPMVLAEES